MQKLIHPKNFDEILQAKVVRKYEADVEDASITFNRVVIFKANNKLYRWYTTSNNRMYNLFKLNEEVTLDVKLTGNKIINLYIITPDGDYLNCYDDEILSDEELKKVEVKYE